MLIFRFRCLLRHRTLHYHPTVAAKIIIACCVLHNKCKVAQIPDVEEHEEQNDWEFEDLPAIEVIERNNILRDGREQRNLLIQALRGPN